MKINTKKLKYGAAATVITIIVVAMVVLLNVIISALSDRYNMSIDLTPGGDFEISDETKDYITSLNEDVEICTTVDELAFETSDSIYYRQAYEVLKKYAYNSDRIDVNFVDMTVDPTYVEKYRQYYDGSISDYSVIVFNNDSHRIRVLSVNDLFNMDINYYTMSQEIVSSKAEQTLTSAIMYVTDPDPQKAVYFNVVHAQNSTGDANGENIMAMLESNGFETVTIDPNIEDIPEDADMLVINAPLNDFSEELIDKIYDFMENDGNYGRNMIYTASYSQNDTPNIDAFLNEWGVKIGKGLVGEDNMQNVISQTSVYAIAAYPEENDYTGGIPSEIMSNPVATFNSRPIEVLYDFQGNVTTDVLLTTSETGFIMTDEMIQEYQETGAEPSIDEQAVTIMAVASKYTFIDTKQVKSNILLLGCDDILNSSFTSQPYYTNGDYFVSAVNKISGKEDGLNIVAKDLTGDTYETNAAQQNALRIVFMVVLPLLVAAAGFTVWLRRRHK